MSLPTIPSGLKILHLRIWAVSLPIYLPHTYAELAGLTGIFIAIPVVAILTVARTGR